MICLSEILCCGTISFGHSECYRVESRPNLCTTQQFHLHITLLFSEWPNSIIRVVHHAMELSPNRVMYHKHIKSHSWPICEPQSHILYKAHVSKVVFYYVSGVRIHAVVEVCAKCISLHKNHAKSVLTICLSESLCCDTAETIPVHQIAFRSSSLW